MYEESKRRVNREEHVLDVQNTVRCNIIQPRSRGESNEEEVLFGEIMTENSPKLVKVTKSHTQEQYVIK